MQVRDACFGSGLPSAPVFLSNLKRFPQKSLRKADRLHAQQRFHSGRFCKEEQMSRSIQYSEKYADEAFEYRHVILPTEVAKLCPKNRLLSEMEWRQIGVQQSRGWEHYSIHKPEPHILLFRRPLGTDPVTGLVPAAAKSGTQASHAAYIQQF